MKNLHFTLAVIVALLSFEVFSQVARSENSKGELVVSGRLLMPGKSEAELFKCIIASSPKNSVETIEASLAETEGTQIIGVGSNSYMVNVYSSEAGNVHYKFEYWILAGEIDYKFTEFTHSSAGSNYASVGILPRGISDHVLLTFSSIQYSEIMKEIKINVETVIGEIENSCLK
jgi:hypothetical protein